MVGLFGNSSSTYLDNSKINVGQFGWSPDDLERVNMLLEYLAKAQELVAVMQDQKINYDKIEPIYEDIVDTYNNIQDSINDLDVKIPQIEDFHTQVKDMYDGFKADKTSFDTEYADAKEIFVKGQDMVLTVQMLKDQILAAASQVGLDSASVLDAKDQVVQIYNELKDGRVYMGIWNPNSGAYPAKPTKTSFWDVKLNAGQAEFVYDGKTWSNGDTLIYLLSGGTFNQIETGAEASVASVNGKKGAVTLTAADVHALATTDTKVFYSIGALTSLDTNNTRPGHFTISGATGDPDSSTTYGHGLILAGGTDTGQGAWREQMVFKHNNRVFSRSFINGAPQPWKEFYTTLHKPTAADIGALPVAGGNISGALTFTTAANQGYGVYKLDMNNTNVGGLNIVAFADPIEATGTEGIVFPKTGKTDASTTPSDYDRFYVLDGKAYLNGSLFYTQDNKPTAAELGVYAKTETYSKTEIDGKVVNPAGKYVPLTGDSTIVGSLSANHFTVVASATTPGLYMVGGSNGPTGDTTFAEIVPIAQGTQTPNYGNALRYYTTSNLWGIGSDRKLSYTIAGNPKGAHQHVGTFSYSGFNDTAGLWPVTTNGNWWSSINFPTGYSTANISNSLAVELTQNQLYVGKIDRSNATTPTASWSPVVQSHTVTTEDLNTLTVPGFYTNFANANATTANHYPTGEAGTLIVTEGPNGAAQEYTTYSSHRKFARGKTSTTEWGPWREYAVSGSNFGTTGSVTATLFGSTTADGVSWGAAGNAGLRVVKANDVNSTWLVAHYADGSTGTIRAGIQANNVAPGATAIIRMYGGLGSFLEVGDTTVVSNRPIRVNNQKAGVNSAVYLGSGNDNYISTASGATYVTAKATGGKVFIEGALDPVARVGTADHVIYHAGNLTAATLGALTTATADPHYVKTAGGSVIGGVTQITQQAGLTIAGGNSGANIASIRYYFGNGLHWHTLSNTNSDFVIGTGAVGSISAKVTISGTTSIVSATDFNVTSDIRLKSDFDTIDGAVDKVCHLRALTYDKHDPDGEFLKREAGVIAQDVLDVLPEAVGKQGDFLTVSTQGIVALLVAAVQELKEEIEELKKGNR